MEIRCDPPPHPCVAVDHVEVDLEELRPVAAEGAAAPPKNAPSKRLSRVSRLVPENRGADGPSNW
jgi:hypothetical protein